MDARKSLRLKVLSLLLFLAAAACLGGSLYLMHSALRSNSGYGVESCSHEDVTEEGDGGGGRGGAHHNDNCREQQQQKQQQQQHERPGGDPGGDRGGSVQSPAGARSRNDDDDNEDDDVDEDDYSKVFLSRNQGAIALLMVSAALLVGSIAALVLGCRAQRRPPAVGLAVDLAVGGKEKEASAPNVYVVMEEPALDEKQWGLPPPLPPTGAVGGPWAQPVALPSYSEVCGVPEGAGQAAP
ncbi:unnamed protein product [Lampetra fluviatilis]